MRRAEQMNERETMLNVTEKRRRRGRVKRAEEGEQR
jgi:hypothetical protein